MFHENIVNELNDSIEKNMIKHAYIFSGQENIGKKEIAINFAKMILCKNDLDIEIFKNGNHPDYKVIEPDEKDSIKVEAIRDLVEDINIKPIRSEYKVYVICDADKITKQAQNALLKTFEEPPKYGVIILVTSKYYSLIDTIRSRGHRVEFGNISESDILKEIQSKNITTKIPQKYLLQLVNGSVKNIQNVLDNEEIICEIIKYFENNIEKIDTYYMSKKLVNAKSNIMDILEYMIGILLTKIKNSSEEKAIVKYNKCIKIVEKTKANVRNNINYEIAIDYLLINIWEAMYD